MLSKWVVLFSTIIKLIAQHTCHINFKALSSTNYVFKSHMGMDPTIHLGTCIYPVNMLCVFVWVESWQLDDMHLNRL